MKHLLLFILLVISTIILTTKTKANYISFSNKKVRKVDTVTYKDGTMDIIKTRLITYRYGEKKETKIIRTYDRCNNLIKKKKTIKYIGCFTNENVKFNKYYKTECK